MEQHEDIWDWNDRELVDISGEKIGTINEVRYDDEMGRPRWVIVKSGLFGTHKNFVPASEVRTSGSELAVPFTKERVKHAPHVSDSVVLTRDDERELNRYYGLDYAA